MQGTSVWHWKTSFSCRFVLDGSNLSINLSLTVGYRSFWVRSRRAFPLSYAFKWKLSMGINWFSSVGSGTSWTPVRTKWPWKDKECSRRMHLVLGWSPIEFSIREFPLDSNRENCSIKGVNLEEAKEQRSIILVRQVKLFNRLETVSKIRISCRWPCTSSDTLYAEVKDKMQRSRTAGLTSTLNNNPNERFLPFREVLETRMHRVYLVCTRRDARKRGEWHWTAAFNRAMQPSYSVELFRCRTHTLAQSI